MPSPSERRMENIIQLVEWAQLQSLNSCSKQIYRLLCQEAKKQFLVTDETAKDYARLAIQILSDPLRAVLELRHMRMRRLEWK